MKTMKNSLTVNIDNVGEQCGAIVFQSGYRIDGEQLLAFDGD